MKLTTPTASLCGCAVLALVAATTPAVAQVAVDGTLTPGEGYSALAVQSQITQWGAGNSLASLQTEQTGKLLNLFVAGRVDGNAMMIFVDSKPGGVSFIRNNLIQSGGFEADINNLGSSDSTGMTFEPGFEPDYAIRIFGAGDEAYASLYDLQKQFRVDLGRVDTLGGDVGSHGPVTAIRAEWQDVDTSDHAAADKGVEIALNMALLGVAEGSQDVRLMAMIVNGNSSFGSNQVLGSLDTNAVMGGSLNEIDFDADYTTAQTLTVAVNRPALLPGDDEDGDGITNDMDPFPLAQTRDIVFSVNMAVQQANGFFTPGSSVQVQFFSGSQAPLSTLTLTDPDENLIYTGTLLDAAGFEGESFGTYKFITNDPSMPNGGYEFGFDRTFTMGAPGSTMNLEPAFFSNEFPSQGFTAWADANAGGGTFNEDFDGDGVPNGMEYFFGETGSSFTATPAPVNGTISWPRDPEAVGVAFKVLISETLAADSWMDVTNDADTSDPNFVRYTLPSGLTAPSKLFAILEVQEVIE